MKRDAQGYQLFYLLVSGPANGETVERIAGDKWIVPIPVRFEITMFPPTCFERSPVCTYTLRDVVVTDNVHMRRFLVMQPEQETTIEQLPLDLFAGIAQP